MLARLEDEETVEDIAKDVGDTESADVAENGVPGAERFSHGLDGQAQQLNRDIVSCQTGEEKPCEEEECDNVDTRRHASDDAILDELDEWMGIMSELLLEKRNHGSIV